MDGEVFPRIWQAARLVKPEGKITDARTAITGIDAGAIHGDSSNGWWSTVVRVEWMNLGLSENAGYIPNEIAILKRDNDQQNHWV